MNIYTPERIEILNKLIKLRDCIDDGRKDGALIYGYKYDTLKNKYNITDTEIKEYDIYIINLSEKTKKTEVENSFELKDGTRFKNEFEFKVHFLNKMGFNKKDTIPFIFKSGWFKNILGIKFYHKFNNRFSFIEYMISLTFKERVKFYFTGIKP